MHRTLTTLALCAIATSTALAAGPASRWQGAVELPQGELAITLALAEGDSGWAGTIDIPIQSLHGFELSGVAVEGRQVRFEMSGIPGHPTFAGELSESGDAITGTFTQGPQSLPFALDRAGEVEADGREPGGATPDAPELPAEPVPGEGLAGEWLGRLEPGPTTLRLALHLEATAAGGLEGSLDSIDQGAEIPIDAVEIDDQGRVKLTLGRIGASFEGVMSDDGSTIAGTWLQGGRELPLTFHRLAQRFTLRRPQHPEGPFPYANREVTFPGGGGEVTLAGTLLLPQRAGPVPAVALVSGSGAQDRDESLMGHRPFLVIADFLARRGIASLRWDDRGVGGSTGDLLASTVGDLAGDVAEAVACLAAQPEIDDAAIGVVGHSEGGLIGPMAAVADDRVGFLVLLAPPGVPLPALLGRQTRDFYAWRGLDPGLIDKAMAMHAEDLELVTDRSLGAEELEARLRALVAKRRAELTDEELAALQVSDAAVDSGIRLAASSWFRSLAREDPADHLRAVDVPVLALFGELDMQVAAEENAAAVRRALAAGAGPGREVRILPGLNHLFQHADTGGLEEYGAIEETFAPEALEAIAAWIERRFTRPSAPPGVAASD